MNITPSWPPGLRANKLTTATTAARPSTLPAMSRVTRRACEVRRVSQTVASWTVSTIEAARVSVTDTGTT